MQHKQNNTNNIIVRINKTKNSPDIEVLKLQHNPKASFFLIN